MAFLRIDRKNYRTIVNNTSLEVPEILGQYKQLFKIEHSFRPFKSHLEATRVPLDGQTH